MKTRVEMFIERCALGSSIDDFNHDDDALDALSRKLNMIGQSELAREVYGLYTEAFMIQRELEHKRKEAKNAVADLMPALPERS